MSKYQCVMLAEYEVDLKENVNTHTQSSNGPSNCSKVFKIILINATVGQWTNILQTF
jgi:hypothetical protein